MRLNLLKRPFLKPKKFCANPIPTYGIPDYANGELNPKVIGTAAHTEFWEEQLYYCLNGYWTAGVYIPPRYYHFLNNCKVSSVDYGKPHSPDFIDFQYDLHLNIEYAKKEGQYKDREGGLMNIIIPKGGRKGLSENGVSIIDYGYRFMDGYKAGVIGGAKENSDDFITKWKSMDSNMVNELKIRKLSKNWDDIVSGWEEKLDTGGYTTKGTGNTIYSRTAFSNPKVLEGKFVNEVVFEEAGMFDKLLETFNSALECMKRGNIQYGTFYIYGRGGNIKTGSKGFEHMWHNADLYNCIKFPVLGKQYYIPCVAGTKDPSGKLIEDIPNLLKYEPYQRIGMEDTDRAEELIKETNERLKKSGDIAKWLKHKQDNPTEEKEFFIRSNSNNFPFEVLNDRMFELNSLGENKLWDKYKLKWKTDSRGVKLQPLEVEVEVAGPETPEADCVMIAHNGMPVPGVKNMFAIGIDAYDMDQAFASKSLGGLLVYERKNQIPGRKGNIPVCIIRTRPPRREQFYERCMMVSVLYNAKRATMIDAAKDAIIKHYQMNGGEKYLAFRPKKYESVNSEQSHKYGMLVPIPKVVHSLMEADIYHHGYKNPFEMLGDELLSYDDNSKYSESDKDLADAYGLALACDGAMDSGVREDDGEPDKEMDMPSSYVDGDGNVRMSIGEEDDNGNENYSM